MMSLCLGGRLCSSGMSMTGAWVLGRTNLVPIAFSAVFSFLFLFRMEGRAWYILNDISIDLKQSESKAIDEGQRKDL